MKNGVIIIDKEPGLTSQGVVSRVKRIFGVSKAGHTGTLDPMATGVLPVLMERGVKASEFMLTQDKHYIATLLLGVTTDTEDVTGEILIRCDAIPDEKAVIRCIEGFVGEYLQTPPMYSALKVGGKKLCDLARQGVTVEREPRKVHIYSICARRIDENRYTLDVKCSKGTYIRTLCADIGARLGCGGCMETLRRATASGFTLDDAHTLSRLENMSEEEREACIFPVEYIFRNLPEVKLPAFFARLAHSGLEIYLKKINLDLPLGSRVRLMDEGGFFALGEVREYEEGAAIKPIRQF